MTLFLALTLVLQPGWSGLLKDLGCDTVALITVYTFLSVNGIELVASEVDAVNLFLDLAASPETQEESMEKLAYWLQSNSELLSNEI